MNILIAIWITINYVNKGIIEILFIEGINKLIKRVHHIVQSLLIFNINKKIIRMINV